MEAMHTTPHAHVPQPSYREAGGVAEDHGVYDEATRPHLSAYWAQHDDEVREAQALRYRVFVEGMGARITVPEGTPAGLDADRFDVHCEHLIVRAHASTQDRRGRVVGTYRVMTPDAALRAGGLYSDHAFDLEAIDPMRPAMVELGRSCVDPDYRQGVVMMLMWSRLAQFMQDNGLRWMVGSASVPVADGGHQAASLWRTLMSMHAAPPSRQVRPRHPLPMDHLQQHLPVEAPPLIRSYLRCGAEILGAPSWDPDFGTADLPMLLDLHNLPQRHQTHFMRA